MSMIDDIKRDREAAPAMPFRLIGCDCEQDCVHDDHNRLVKKRRSRVPDMEAALILAEGLAEAYESLCEMTGKDYHKHECSKFNAFRVAIGAA